MGDDVSRLSESWLLLVCKASLKRFGVEAIVLVVLVVLVL